MIPDPVDRKQQALDDSYLGWLEGELIREQMNKDKLNKQKRAEVA